MVSIKKIARGAFLRVLPTGALLMGIGLALTQLGAANGLSRWAPLIAAGEMISASLGFFSVLALLRKRLSADAPIDGRPGVVAGLATPVVVMVSLMIVRPSHSIPGLVLSSALAGGIVALSMFAPWLSKLSSRQMSNTSEPDLLPSAAEVEPKERAQPEKESRGPSASIIMCAT